jgi:AraC-like DNA-binding protein
MRAGIWNGQGRSSIDHPTEAWRRISSSDDRGKAFTTCPHLLPLFSAEADDDFTAMANVCAPYHCLLTKAELSGVRLKNALEPEMADYACIVVCDSGRIICRSADGTDAEISAGGVAVFDFAHDFSADFEACRTTVVFLAKNEFTGCRVMPRDHPLAPLVCDALHGLVASQPALDPQAMRACLQSLRLLTAPVAAPEPPLIPTDRRGDIVAYIDRHLADVELSPEAIAQGIGMSRPTLYRTLEGEGGVAALILTRRLERARAALEMGADRHVSLGKIAGEYGFSTQAHFSRAFKARFGRTPGSVRRDAGQSTSGADPLGRWFDKVAIASSIG